MPWLTAILLGFMTSISPCPLATNITAIGFISKDIENRNRVFLNGLFYTLGRAVTYTSIALIIYFGADQFRFSGFFQQYGEKGDPQGQLRGTGRVAAVAEEFVDAADGRPEDGDGGGDDKGSDDHGGN